MTKYFDENKWNKLIKLNDWYLKLDSEFTRLEKLKKSLGEKETENLKEEVYRYIEKNLENGGIPLNDNGPDWETERKSIEVIVIHHTSNDNPLTLNRLNAKHLLNLYAPFYKNPNDENRDIKGTAIWSGHFVNEKQVFYGYHWLIKLDGTTIRLLDDKYIGWHAGNWDVNTKSIGICIDGNFESETPSKIVINSIAKLINTKYDRISKDSILGHREVNPSTVCPGNSFLDSWKMQLLDLI